MTTALCAGLLAAMLALNFGVLPAQAQSPAPKSATNAPKPDAAAQAVKKSKTSICHAAGSTYYDRTLNFTPFATMDECIKSGGRLPKR